VTGLVRLLAIALLLGTFLLGVGAVFHPMLAADAAAQLRTMASTPYWSAIHHTMLAGSGLVIAGVWVRLVVDRGSSSLLVAALVVVTTGIALNALDIAFMAGSGARMATLFAAGDARMATIYDVTHPSVLVAARFGNFIVALGAVMLGGIEWRDPSRPRWLAWLAWIAAAGGFVGVFFFADPSRIVFAAVALLSLWEVGTALLALRRPAVPLPNR
jgi:hypothetical protein